ncbi:MAG: hypothetical protein RLY70_213 [Planctomycetota bacterium]|jgi:hypothetical protein
MSVVKRHRGSRRSGQALLELAIVSFALTLMLAAVIAIGMLLFADQTLQQAVDVGAQELARLPLPPVLEFPPHGAQAGFTSATQRTSTNPNAIGTLFANSAVRSRIFDESYLVVDITAGASELAAGQTLDDYFAAAPLLNRLLRPVMIYEEVLLDGESTPRRLVRFPGALVRNGDTAAPGGHEDLTVLIPVVRERGGLTGRGVPVETETLSMEWRSVVEEIRAASAADPTVFYGPFSLLQPTGATPPAGFEPGFVALRLNYPFQAASLVGFQYKHADNSIDGQAAIGEEGLQNLPVGADDSGVVAGATPPAPYQLVATANAGFGPNAGRLGMGRQAAFGGIVRPFRRVLSTQAIYRREVFE